MLKLKIFLFLFGILQVNLVFAHEESFEDAINSLELSKIEPLSSEEAALKPKANWQPICQEVLINGLEEKPIQSESEVVFLPQEIPGIVISPVRKGAKSCIAPNGGGLTTFLKEAYQLLPHEKLNAIIQEASHVPEFEKLSKLFNSDEFQNNLTAFFKTNAFVVFRDYACQKLYLNVDDFLDFKLATFNMDDFKEINAFSRASLGLQNLLQDIKDALPYDQLKKLLKQKLESDEYLREAKERIKSKEFHQIIKALREQPEYIALKNQLKSIGLTLDTAVENVRKILSD